MDKKTGYLLLLLGCALILGSAGVLVLTFYGSLPLPDLFKLNGNITMTLQGNPVTLPVPPQLNRAANLSAFLMFVLLLGGAGARLGRLGISLIKDKDAPAK
jgi:hypothetical protein